MTRCQTFGYGGAGACAGHDTSNSTLATPRAWVGCLACYNAGRLVGEWVDGLEAGDYVPCERPGHEEWGVLDHEGYGPLLSGECSPAEAQRLAELLEKVPGGNLSAFFAFIDHYGTPTDDDLELVLGAFEEAYAGEWRSEREYAEEMATELGLLSSDETLARYFDYEAWTRDLFIGDYYSAHAPGGGVFVFHRI